MKAEYNSIQCKKCVCRAHLANECIKFMQIYASFSHKGGDFITLRPWDVWFFSVDWNN